MDGPSVVYLHVGPPKTGTTYLQDVLWRNRPALAEHGIMMPGKRPADHFQAGFALRGLPTVDSPQSPDEPDAWDRIAQQIRSADNAQAAVISDERLAACTERDIARAVDTLHPAEVRVVYGLRAPVEVVVSEWQQTVKGGNVQTFDEFLTTVRTRRHDAPVWFWKVHDLRAVMQRWTAAIGPERFHLVTMPPPGSDKQLLWQRFASVLGIPADGFDLDVQSNPSLGRKGVELIRQVNRRRPRDYPRRYQLRINRDMLGDRILARRTGKEKLAPPPHAIQWAQEYTEELTEVVKTSSCPVVGDVTDLRRDDLLPSDGVELPSLTVPPVAVDALVGLLQQTGRQIDRTRKVVQERDTARAARDNARRERDRLRRELDNSRRTSAALQRQLANLEQQLATERQLIIPSRLRRNLVDLAGRHRSVGLLLSCWRSGRRLVTGLAGRLPSRRQRDA